MYIESDVDFEIIQRAHIEIINTTNTKVILIFFLLKNIGSYAEFKEIIHQSHEKLLNPGIQKMTKLFKKNHFFPNRPLLIQNIINECNICNLAKTEDRNTKMPLKNTPKLEHCRDKFVVYIYSSEGKHYISCIDIYFKFATLANDWIECRNALIR